MRPQIPETLLYMGPPRETFEPQRHRDTKGHEEGLRFQVSHLSFHLSHLSSLRAACQGEGNVSLDKCLSK